MQTIRIRQAALAVAAVAALSGCATVQTPTKGDPLEGFNRSMYKFNDTVDTYALKPVAKGYQKVTPKPLRTAFSNFFSNLGDLNNAANNLLQLHITDAVEDIMRFAFNTTFGIGGLLDWATPAGLPKHSQDFGLTLGRWGVPAGPYLVLPIFGPSSIRDGLGRVVDVRFNPLNYMEPVARNPLYALQFVSARSDMLGATDLLQQAALDKYSFVRDAYTQQRRAKLQRDDASPAALPDYGDPDSQGGAAPAAPAAPASGAATVPSAGVPQYTDPGDAASEPAAAPAPGSSSAGGSGGGKASAQSPANVPIYTDPGDGAASGTAPASAPAPAGK